jgi:hypothetical protein
MVVRSALAETLIVVLAEVPVEDGGAVGVPRPDGGRPALAWSRIAETKIHDPAVRTGLESWRSKNLKFVCHTARGSRPRRSS